MTLGTDHDYINANFIKMTVKDEIFSYIACQGPLSTTLTDFWQMVWEQKSDVIAMMTQEVENDKVKCLRYWPDTPLSPLMVGETLQITLIKDQHLDNFIIRLFEMQDIQVRSLELKPSRDTLVRFGDHLNVKRSSSLSVDERNPTGDASELHGLARPRHAHSARTAVDLHLLHETRPPVRTHHHSLQCWDRTIGDAHLRGRRARTHQ